MLLIIIDTYSCRLIYNSLILHKKRLIASLKEYPDNCLIQNLLIEIISSHFWALC